MKQLTYIRHGEHESEELFSGLSSLGCEEIRGLDIDRDPGTVGVAPESSRFLGSVALALYPDIANEDLDSVARGLLSKSRIYINNSLDYKDPSVNVEFMGKMFDAYESGRSLRFFVSESDRYDGDISSYASMAGVIAKSVLESSDGKEVICAREFFMPSFRAKITNLAKSRDIQHEYIEWYEANKELSPQARTDIVVIHKHEDEYILEDQFGEIDFHEADLYRLVNDTAK